MIESQERFVLTDEEFTIMESKETKQKKQKPHGNEKPLKIKMTFDKAVKKIAKVKPPQNK
jgi:hypothetical protein